MVRTTMALGERTCIDEFHNMHIMNLPIIQKVSYVTVIQKVTYVLGSPFSSVKCRSQYIWELVIEY